MTIEGYISRIVYRNESNGYTVIYVESEDDDYTLVGSFSYVETGMHIQASGEEKYHPNYGPQIEVREYTLKNPEDEESVRRYLASGAVKGIGEALATRIVKKFKADTMRILEEEPERLAEIKGISERMAMAIGAQIEEKKDVRDALIFLSRYGIGMSLALRIWNTYGPAIYSIIVTNPYQLADEMTGVGFKIADDIAVNVGIPADSEYRMKAGIIYALNEAGLQGHMYLPAEELITNCAQLLGMQGQEEEIRKLLSNLQMEKKIVVRKTDAVYLASAYYTELGIARMLEEINSIVPIRIITGGPGTGKTTNIKRLIEEYESAGLTVALAAPTGRAAKRMTEATGHEASTIHRLLEVKVTSGKLDGSATGDKHDGAGSSAAIFNPDDSSSLATRFDRNETHPLEYDAIIIDEMSMVDAYLMRDFLRAVMPGTKLVLVGDINQLPSVGPGNVLRDIIESEKFDTLRLNKIYRQEETSDIIENAHRMINEEPIDLNKKSKDFLFIKRDGSEAIIAAMLTLIKEKLPDYVGATPMELQVLTPMRKGALGMERLNGILQEVLNPKNIKKNEKELSGIIYREGDKVMQIKNNYDKSVYNGDIGYISRIDSFAEELTVEFEDGRELAYAFTEVEELELAYAITVHKSQGSEYPAVIVPVAAGPKLLMTRNLIYTAVTRARKCVCLVGDPKAFNDMVTNTTEMKRYSGLKDIE